MEDPAVFFCKCGLDEFIDLFGGFLGSNHLGNRFAFLLE